MSPQILEARPRAVLPRKDVRRGRGVEGLFQQPARQDEGTAVNAEYLIVGIIASLVLLYLFYALLRPEKL